jgi:hypothetical protein
MKLVIALPLRSEDDCVACIERIVKHVGYYLEVTTKCYRKRSLNIAESTDSEHFRRLAASTAHIRHAVATDGYSTIRNPRVYIWHIKWIDSNSQQLLSIRLSRHSIASFQHVQENRSEF